MLECLVNYLITCHLSPPKIKVFLYFNLTLLSFVDLFFLISLINNNNTHWDGGKLFFMLYYLLALFRTKPNLTVAH